MAKAQTQTLRVNEFEPTTTNSKKNQASTA